MKHTKENLMNDEYVRKFAAAIEREVHSQVKPHPGVTKSTLPAQFGIMLAGVFVLLGLCFAMFDGKMVPAMWQLTSVFWLMYRINKMFKN